MFLGRAHWMNIIVEHLFFPRLSSSLSHSIWSIFLSTFIVHGKVNYKMRMIMGRVEEKKGNPEKKSCRCKMIKMSSWSKKTERLGKEDNSWRGKQSTVQMNVILMDPETEQGTRKKKKMKKKDEDEKSTNWHGLSSANLSSWNCHNIYLDSLWFHVQIDSLKTTFYLSSSLFHFAISFSTHHGLYSSHGLQHALQDNPSHFKYFQVHWILHHPNDDFSTFAKRRRTKKETKFFILPLLDKRERDKHSMSSLNWDVLLTFVQFVWTTKRTKKMFQILKWQMKSFLKPLLEGKSFIFLS